MITYDGVFQVNDGLFLEYSIPELQLEDKFDQNQGFCVYQDQVPELLAGSGLLHDGIAEGDERVEQGNETCIPHHADYHEEVTPVLTVGYHDLK